MFTVSSWLWYHSNSKSRYGKVQLTETLPIFQESQINASYTGFCSVSSVTIQSSGPFSPTVLLQDGGIGFAGSSSASFWIAPAEMKKVTVQFSTYLHQYGTLAVNFSPKSSTAVSKIVFWSSQGLNVNISSSAVTCNGISATVTLNTNLTITFTSAQTFSGDVACTMSNSVYFNSEMTNTAVGVMTLSAYGSSIDSGTTFLTVTYNKLTSPSIVISDGAKGKTSSLSFSFQYRLLPAVSVAKIMISGLSGFSLSSGSAATCSGLNPSEPSVAMSVGSLVLSFSTAATASSDFIQCSVSRVVTSSSGTFQISMKTFDLFGAMATGDASSSLFVFPYSLSNLNIQYRRICKMAQPMIISFSSASVAAVSSIVLSFSSKQLLISTAGGQQVQCSRGSGTFSISNAAINIALTNPQSLYGSIVCTLSGVLFSTFGNYTDDAVVLGTFVSGSPDSVSSQQAFHLAQNSVNLLRVYSAFAVAGQSDDFALEFSRDATETTAFALIHLSGFPPFSLSNAATISCAGLTYDVIIVRSGQSHVNVSFPTSAVLSQGHTSFTCTISTLQFNSASSSNVTGLIFSSNGTLMGAAISNLFNVSTSSLTQTSLQVPALFSMAYANSGWTNLSSVNAILSFSASSSSYVSSVFVSFVSSVHNSFHFIPQSSAFSCNRGSGTVSYTSSFLEFNSVKLLFSSAVSASGVNVCTIAGRFFESKFNGSDLEIPVIISTSDLSGKTQASSKLLVNQFSINRIRNYTNAPSVVMSPSIVGNPSFLTVFFQYDQRATVSSILVTGLTSVSFVSSPACECSGIDTTDLSITLESGTLNISFPFSSGVYDDFVVCTVQSVLPSTAGILSTQISVYSALQGLVQPVLVGSSQVIPIGVASQKPILALIDSSNSQFKVVFASQYQSNVQSINIVFSPLGPSALSSAICYIGTTALAISSVTIVGSKVAMTFQTMQYSLSGTVSCTLYGFQSGKLKFQDFVISPVYNGQNLAYIPGHILGQGFKGT